MPILVIPSKISLLFGVYHNATLNLSDLVSKQLSLNPLECEKILSNQGEVFLEGGGESVNVWR